MEPPTKRAKIGYALLPLYDDDDDEISMGPAEFAARQDPDFQLQRSRHAASTRLKSTLEDIFDKYGKDFGDEGDEIDLYSGEVVVDNGHLRSLGTGREGGTRSKSFWGGKQKKGTAGGEEEDSSDEEERILHGKKDTSMAVIPRSLPPPSHPAARGVGTWGQAPFPFGAAGPPRLTSMFGPSGFQFTNGPLSFGAFGNANAFVDPRWQAPELPVLDPSRSILSHFGSGSTRMVPIKTVARKALPAPAEDADEEDDILLAPAEPLAVPEKALVDSKDTQHAQRASLTAHQAMHGVFTHGIDGNKENEMSKILGHAQPKKRSNPKSRSKDVAVGNAASVTPTSKERSGKPQQPSAGRTRPQSSTEGISKSKLLVTVTEKKSSKSSNVPVTQPAQGVTAKAKKKGRPRKANPQHDEVEGHLSRDLGDVENIDIPLPDGSFEWGHGAPRSESLTIEIFTRKVSGPHEISYDGFTKVETTELEQETPVQSSASHDGPESTRLIVTAATSVVDAEIDATKQAAGEMVEPTTAEEPKATSKVSPETFLRNTVDPSFAFSDEEDGFVVKKPRQKSLAIPEPQPAQEQSTQATGINMPLHTTDQPDQAPDTTSEIPSPVPTQEPTITAVEVTAPPQITEQTVETPDATPEVFNPEPALALTDEEVPEPTTVVSPPEPPFMETPAPLSKKRTPRVHSAKTKRREETRTKKALARSTPSKQPHTSPTPLQQPLPSPPTVPPRPPRRIPTSASRSTPLSQPKPSNPPRITTPPKSTRTPLKPKTPFSATTSLLDLMSDSEDELSLGPDDFTPGGHKLPHSSSSPVPPSSPSSALVNNKRAAVTLSRKLLCEPRRRRSTPLLYRGRNRGAVVSSPVDSSVVRTPGGTRRKCGVDGFLCGRDFCFVCLRD